MTLPGRGARRSGPKAPARPHMAAGRGAGSGDCRGRPASVPASPPPSHPLRRRLAPRARGLPAGGLGFALFLPLFLTGQAGPGGGISGPAGTTCSVPLYPVPVCRARLGPGARCPLRPGSGQSAGTAHPQGRAALSSLRELRERLFLGKTVLPVFKVLK